jgi:hypothetical protein
VFLWRYVAPKRRLHTAVLAEYVPCVSLVGVKKQLIVDRIYPIVRGMRQGCRFLLYPAKDAAL